MVVGRFRTANSRPKGPRFIFIYHFIYHFIYYFFLPIPKRKLQEKAATTFFSVRLQLSSELRPSPVFVRLFASLHSHRKGLAMCFFLNMRECWMGVSFRFSYPLFFFVCSANLF